jgi:hypothetical protein
VCSIRPGPGTALGRQASQAWDGLRSVIEQVTQVRIRVAAAVCDGGHLMATLTRR